MYWFESIHNFILRTLLLYALSAFCHFFVEIKNKIGGFRYFHEKKLAFTKYYFVFFDSKIELLKVDEVIMFVKLGFRIGVNSFQLSLIEVT